MDENKQMKEGHDNSFDISISHPYYEIDQSLPGSRPFDDASLKQSFNEALPAPIKFNKVSTPDTCHTSCGHGAIVSLLKPHKILAASNEFLNTVGFTSSQVCGRSISSIFGPRTDTVRIMAAIKNTGHLETTEVNTVLYASNGREVDLCATLRPHLVTSGRGIGGCLLQIRFIRCGQGPEAPGPVFILEDFGLDLANPAPGSPKADSDALRRRRRAANAVTGIETDAERSRQTTVPALPTRAAAAAARAGPV